MSGGCEVVVRNCFTLRGRETQTHSTPFGYFEIESKFFFLSRWERDGMRGEVERGEERGGRIQISN